MEFRFPCAAALALAFAAAAAPLPAQTCPMQTTQHVPSRVTNGPVRDCGGSGLQLVDVQVRFDAGQCPTFLLYEPPHEIAVPATTQTYVEVVGQNPITMVTFECRTQWLLFLPIGTECVRSGDRNVGSVLRLVARPCSEL